MTDPTTPTDPTEPTEPTSTRRAARSDAEAAWDLAELLLQAGLSCAVNPYEPTSVIVALLADTIAPYAQEAPGPDEDREEFVPAMAITARAPQDSDEIRCWEGRLENLTDPNDPARETTWGWKQHSSQDLAWVGACITATITMLRAGASAYLQSREDDRQTAAAVRRDSAEALARALHPASTTVTSYSTHADVHFRTDDGVSGTIQIHGLQDARIEISRIHVERLTLLANALGQHARSAPLP